MNLIYQLQILAIAIFFSVPAFAQSPGWFTRVPAHESGLTDSTGVYFVAVADMNNDTFPDIAAVYVRPGASVFSERRPIRIFLNTQAPGNNTKKRRFIDVTPQTSVNIVPPDTGNHANFLTLADFNNDGNIDMVTGSFYHRLESIVYPNDRPQVYLGDGTGNFVWKPNNGLETLDSVNMRALTTLDYDRDGNLDLFLPVWFVDLSGDVMAHNRLLKGHGDGTFTDVTSSSGIQNHLDLTAAAAAMDWNNDCYPDVLTAPYCRTGGMLFKNEGNGTFTNVASDAGYNLYRWGNLQRVCTFSIIPEDINNDGYMDAFLAVIHGGNDPGQFRSTIAINNGPNHNYSFDINENLLPVQPPASVHRGDYDATFLDMDNDGRKDIIMTQGIYMPGTDRTYFWHQQQDGTFKEVTQDLGLLIPELKSSQTVQAFDYDLDGDDDFLITGTHGSYFDLWENTVNSGNNYLAIELQAQPGTNINYNAIGARIYVYYDSNKMIMREVMAGRGHHTGQQPFILNFGLGNTPYADSVIIRWPDVNCTQTRLYNVPAKKRVAAPHRPDTESSTRDIQKTSQVKYFPNPVSKYLVAQGEHLVQNTRDVYVLDATGKSVSVTPSGSDNDKFIFDFEPLPPGVYFIQLRYTDGTTVTHKIFRE